MAFANEKTCTVGGVTYSYALDRLGNALVTGCEATGGTVAIPAELDGHPVTALGDGSFAKLVHVTRITCPESVRAVGRHAFEQCRSLRRIAFPASLDTFDPEWMTGCTCLEDVVLPGRVPTIPQGLFGIGKIRSLHIGRETRVVELPRAQPLALAEFSVDPESLWLMTDGLGLYSYDGDVLFALVRECGEYRVAEGCTRIDPYAFAYRDGLSRVHLPDTLREIGDLAFLGCGIREFAAPRALRRIGKRAFMGCPSLSRASLNDGLEEIGEGAFARTGLEGMLEVPPTVQRLGTSIAGFPEELGRLAPRVRLADGNAALFMDGQGLVYRRSAEGLVLQDASCFTGQVARLDEGTAAVAPGAFKRHRFVERVIMPEGVTSIGAAAFAHCLRLTQVDLPDTLLEIGDAAFSGTSLRELSIPASCTRIGERALDTTARREATVKGGVQRVAMSSLRRAAVDPGNPVYHTASGLLCRRLPEHPGESEAVLYVGPDSRVIVPRDVTAIAPYAFSGVTGIDLLRLHGGIRSIGTAALFPASPFKRIELEITPSGGGADSVGVDLPPDELGMNVLRSALHRAVDPPLLMECYDAAIPHFTDPFERYRRMLERLADPVFLAEWARHVYERDLARDARRVCLILASHNHVKGLDQLVGLGLADADVLSEVIDQLAGNVVTVSATARLLELRRIRFGQAHADFAL